MRKEKYFSGDLCLCYKNIDKKPLDHKNLDNYFYQNDDYYTLGVVSEDGKKLLSLLDGKEYDLVQFSHGRLRGSSNKEASYVKLCTLPYITLHDDFMHGYCKNVFCRMLINIACKNQLDLSIGQVKRLIKQFNKERLAFVNHLYKMQAMNNMEF